MFLNDAAQHVETATVETVSVDANVSAVSPVQTSASAVMSTLLPCVTSVSVRTTDVGLPSVMSVTAPGTDVLNPAVSLPSTSQQLVTQDDSADIMDSDYHPGY